MMVSTHSVEVVTTWVGAVATLAILSVVLKENRFYRFFEHLFIGVATGFFVVQTWQEVLSEKWWQPMVQGQWFWILAPLVALLFYAVYFPKYAWLSRFTINVLFGLGAGQAFRSFANQVFPQVGNSFLPILPIHGVSLALALSNLIFVLTLLCVMTYFFFSFKHTNKVITGSSKAGRWLLMTAFGAIFGTTVMARFSLLIDRIQFILGDWLHLVK